MSMTALIYPHFVRQIWRLLLAAALVLGLAYVLLDSVSQSSPRAEAASLGPSVRINQVLGGANGDSHVQFIELEAQDSNQKCWGPQTPTSACPVGVAETTGRAMLLFFDSTGKQTGRYVFPHNPGGTANTVLVATAGLAALPGAPTPDFLISPEIMANSGQVCWRGNPDNPNAGAANKCLSYGAFLGPQQNNAAAGDAVAGPFSGPANGVPFTSPGVLVTSTLAILNATSINRVNLTFGDQSNTDFTLSVAPQPHNSAGQTFSFPLATQAQQGQTLFFKETFSGNGRTCATCHTPQDQFGLSPATVASRPPSDALFVDEFNLNTLTLTVASFPSDLRGPITATNGLTTTVVYGSLNSYQVYSGTSGLVGKTVTDGNGNSGVVASFALGDLNNLETPRLMRGGRALILVNPDGFAGHGVNRESPNLLNIINTGPYGLSALIPGLDTFSAGAVVQHNPRHMARVEGVDFRAATSAELNAMVAFMSTIVLPADRNFSLDRFATTEQQKRGRKLFFTPSGIGFNCFTCHQDLQLSAKQAFNTQVFLQTINDAQHDNLPVDNKNFNVTALFDLRDTAPYEHDNSISVLSDAVAFYAGPEFQAGPMAFLVDPAPFSPQNVADVTAFLMALVEPVVDFTPNLTYGVQIVGAGPGASQTITITNISTGTVTVSGMHLTAPGAADFQFSAVPDGTSIGVSQTLVLSATFAPLALGVLTATLEFSSTDFLNRPDAYGVALTGTGVFNIPPTISAIGGQVTNEDTPTQAITFTIGDIGTPVSSLTVTASSSDQNLVPPANLVLGGADANRTLTITPAANMNGAATVTVSVSDGVSTTSTSFGLTVNAVNDAPSFTPGAGQTVLEDAGQQTLNGWASNISPGPFGEGNQTLTFTVTNDNPTLFTAVPTLSSNSTLSYRPAANANGSAVVTATLKDSGGTANGGVDTSAPASFTINVTLVNDAPSFTPGANQNLLEDAGPQTVSGWATNISPGPANEAGQLLTFITTASDPTKFAVQPAIGADGTLNYTTAADANGLVTVTVNLKDDGGTANDGVDTSAPASFTIDVTPVNDAPSFTPGASLAALEDAGPQTVTGWATNISPGPADEAAQTLTIIVTNSNTGLFSAQPALSANGTLSYTPAHDATGSAVVTVTVQDNGGTANGGVDTSAPQTFSITIAQFVANLDLVQSANPSEVAPGQPVTYTLVFNNVGPSLAAGVQLADIVPANLISVTYISSGAVITPTGLNSYTWQVADLAPGAGGLITITGVLNGGARGSVFTNTATITTTTADANLGNNSSAVGVTVANAAPVAVGDYYTLSANASLAVTAPGVLANDSDANDDVLTATLVAGPSTGNLALQANGAFTYTPPPGYTGQVTFTYEANDGQAESNPVTVTLTVEFKLYLPWLVR
jgi:uncharacterized repeat protein (TIGR01451 family)